MNRAMRRKKDRQDKKNIGSLKTMEYSIDSLFPIPVYRVQRDSDLTPEEEIDIDKIIEEGMHDNSGNSSNSSSNNSYIFNGKLKNIKQFCEQHLKIYVEKVICPKEELELYITQSWLNITNPGGFHHIHFHPNSIISGVFYISIEEDDKIAFTDPNFKIKDIISFERKEKNIWNSIICEGSVENNKLLLFPSWLNHAVEPNKKATTDRISLSFNTFVKGKLGSQHDKTELIL